MLTGKKISIDGGIGVGKTTFLNKLQFLLNDVSLGCLTDNTLVITEKTEQWDMWIHSFNTNMERYSFPFQMRILLDKIKEPYDSTKINIYERSPYSLHNIFGNMLVENGFMNDDEFTLEQMYIEQLAWKPDYIIHLYCDLETTKSHIEKHSVEYNKEIDEQYLANVLHQYEFVYDPSICEIPVFKVDTSCNEDEVFKTIIDILNRLNDGKLISSH